jgi:hypothetical protein
MIEAAQRRQVQRLRQLFQSCRQRLRKDIEMEPSAETVALFHRLDASFAKEGGPEDS